MDVTASARAAVSIARALADHKAKDVIILDVADLVGWTDRFVIATASSSVHLRGLERVTIETAAELDIQPLRKGSRTEDDEWVLVDLGALVIHLMTERTRGFYELEKLWFQAKVERINIERKAGSKPLE